MSYVTGSHAFKVGTAVSEGNWRLLEEFTGDVSTITYTSGAPSTVDPAAADRSPQTHQGRRRHLRPGSLDDGARDAEPRAALRLVPGRDRRGRSAAEPRTTPGIKFGKCADGKNDLAAGLRRQGPGLEGHLAARRRSRYDVFGDGRTALKASVARYVAGQQIAVANANNPVTALGLTEDTAVDQRRRRQRVCRSTATATSSSTSSGRRPSTPTFGRNISTTRYDQDVLNGWFERGYNWEYQHRRCSTCSSAGRR